MAKTAICTSNITFQGNQKKIFQPRQMRIYDSYLYFFRQDKYFNFVNWLFASPTSAYAFYDSN